jgi:hypothetical protein
MYVHSRCLGITTRIVAPCAVPLFALPRRSGYNVRSTLLWLRGSLLLSVEDGRATLGVPAAPSVDWLRHRLNRVVLRALNRHLDPPVAAPDVVLRADVAKRGDT